ncbi:MAG: aminotransferase class III-fold pyridoxal phosphate-dependent enzyme [Crocinitomicaceae bacterium]|nr:aminotransferase class III-fold pyridoxal phosphate-dependent enzyme [Crocinitomicaceae bacterium]
MQTEYQNVIITQERALEIATEIYNIYGDIQQLPGESDFNFRITNGENSYLLKISRPDENSIFIEFQQALLQHIKDSGANIESPKTIPDIHGKRISTTIDDHGNERLVRLLTWTHGRMWSSVNPITEHLLLGLGKQAGKLTQTLSTFEHPFAHRDYEWDLQRVLWTKEHLHLFTKDQAELIINFLTLFENQREGYLQLRKGIVHSDVNDNNVVVTEELINPSVRAIIDYGDAIHTQIINDLAITVAYAIMDKPDPLNAAVKVVEGYHTEFPLTEQELTHLYTLVAMRLVITVTKSAINKEKEPDNEYLLISEKPAWRVLEKWIDVRPNLAHCFFRKACGYAAHPNKVSFENWSRTSTYSLDQLFPSLDKREVHSVDMSVSSTWLGAAFEYNDLALSAYKIDRLQSDHSSKIIAGGYGEVRPFYSTRAYEKEGNNGTEYRTTHLGVDFWVDPQTPIHALFAGKVISLFNNDNDKDYGPTLILEHTTNDGVPFWTLYGHLSKSSLDLLQVGQSISQGDLIAYVGGNSENGNWVPHLHFQIMLDLLGNQHDFPGVATPKDAEVWKSICPDPNQLFKLDGLQLPKSLDQEQIIGYRKTHLGKSLSVSYEKPLTMVRGNGAHLIDITGRRYLDTVNNVAHVGHEHPRVVQAGQQQMALLNTNTRYLHENINEFAKELLATFPDELNVVHFVNSGSEANELALRMAKAVTKQKDMIAVEVGYHGNANACIDISSYKFDGKGGKGAPEHTHIVPLPDTYRGMYQGEDAGEQYVSHINAQLTSIQSKGRNVAAFICESIISCGGQIELPQGYLTRVYQAVREAGGICISDEVQVGCGRMGSEYWGFQLHDVIPDIITIGKPIGNGHPLAAVVCTRAVADAFANGMEYFNTFGGNPVSSAIGKEVLTVIREEKLKENALSVGNYLKSELSRLQQDFPIIGHVRGQGLFLGFELVDQEKQPLTDKATYLANRMKDVGILMSTDGKDNNVLKIKPPLVFSRGNADELILRLTQILTEDFMGSL